MSVVNLRKRTVLLFCIVLAALVTLAGRLAWLQFYHGESLRQKAVESRTREVPIEAKRGTIYDRAGRPLAISVNVDSVFAIPPQVRDAEATARQVADILGLSYEDALYRLTRDRAFVWLARKVDEEAAQKLKLLRLPGIGFTQEARRFYPHDRLAAHVLGVVGTDPVGLEGIEVTYDSYLRGIPGKIVVEYDARGRTIPQAMHKYFPPQDGMSLVLCLDQAIQYMVERELDRIQAEFSPKRAGIVVMEVKTGCILAMGQRPTYDANRWSEAPLEVRRNWLISDSYPPGSTFKPFTLAAAVEAGVVKWTDRFFDPGSIAVPGKRVRCWKAGGHGSQDATEALVNSCNVALVQMGLRLGPDRFAEYYFRFGLGEPTGIDLPGEAVGLFIPAGQMRQVDLAVMSFGQTLTVTPIQMLMGINTIANDGLLVRPHLLKEVRSPEGDLLLTYQGPPPRQVLSPETAREMRRAMEEVVREGTGRTTYLAGHRLAGKTGTSQKVMGGVVSSQAHIASFAGFGPADDPVVSAIVVADEPQGSMYGGQVAAPAFGRLMYDIYRYLDVALRPDEPPKRRTLPPVVDLAPDVEVVEVPSVAGLPSEEARKVLHQAGLAVRLEGEGPVAVDQWPPAGATVPEQTAVVVKQGPAAGEDDLVVVPNLEGRTMREVGEILNRLGLRFSPKGSGLAWAQDPAPGVLIRPGGVVEVEFRPPTD